MKYLKLIVACVLLVPMSASADDETVYESISGVAIGRIFYSQSDRDYLDAQRLLPPKDRAAHAGLAEHSAVTARKMPSAGFIVSNDGGRKIWKDGDFVSTAGHSANSMSFPGDVKITRHTPSESSLPAQEAHDDSEAKSVSPGENDDKLPAE